MTNKLKEHLEWNWHLYFSGALLFGVGTYLYLRDYVW